jgi:ribonuclease P/MRP protein subunit POP1
VHFSLHTRLHFPLRIRLQFSMPPKGPPPAGGQQGKKRKDPSSSAIKQHAAKRPRFDSGSKMRDARFLATQTTSKAFKHGELDVDKFVKSREYEIRALEQGLARSKKALTKRAFQQVPKELRRRTASHNVKRIPKRLRERGKREVGHCPGQTWIRGRYCAIAL